MQFSKEYNLEVGLSEEVNTDLNDFLIRDDGQEDLLFAYWSPSIGLNRITALVHSPVFPSDGDRNIHGNVSFNTKYLERVCYEAESKGYGIALLHSHPFPGWQHMSQDDIEAEKKISNTIEALTDYPLLGMTLGNDGTWSARFWKYKNSFGMERIWADSVKVIGERLNKQLSIYYSDPYSFKEDFKRTKTVWGEENHLKLANLTYGIVGAGSVGSLIGEMLARMGMRYYKLIDFDYLKRHNLDRTNGTTIDDIGKKKIDILSREIHKSATADNIKVETYPYPLQHEKSYRAALDCDVIFSCVDKPRPRYILNHIAYAHLIPVIDGGISVKIKNGEMSTADWQVQTVAPGRPCLECIGAYNPADVSIEMEGLLDDDTYLKGLDDNHHYKRNENIFPFSSNLASLAIFQMIALVTGLGGYYDFGVKRFRFIPNIISPIKIDHCNEECITQSQIGLADTNFVLYEKQQKLQKSS